MLKFDDRGLVTAVVQDARSGAVLMVAHMNQEALDRTVATREVWFYSRSRQELWHKGETSGNFLHLQSIMRDCDGDALLLQVIPDGPACHTGNVTCFFETLPTQSEV